MYGLLNADWIDLAKKKKKRKINTASLGFNEQFESIEPWILDGDWTNL